MLRTGFLALPAVTLLSAVPAHATPSPDGTCDGTGGSGSACPAKAGQGVVSDSVSVTTTGGSGGCLVIFVYTNSPSGQPADHVTSISGSGLSFSSARQTVTATGPGFDGSSEGFDLEEWASSYTGTLSADTVTVTWNTAANNNYSIQAVAVKGTVSNGCNFDSSTNSKATQASTIGGTTTVSQTTSQAHDLLLETVGLDCSVTASGQLNPSLFGGSNGTQTGFGYQTLGTNYVTTSSYDFSASSSGTITDTFKLNSTGGTACSGTFQYVGMVDALTSDSSGGGGGSTAHNLLLLGAGR